jgi:MerR family transcriptional regulator, Zn(II)-responsive regulator of zntA
VSQSSEIEERERESESPRAASRGDVHLPVVGQGRATGHALSEATLTSGDLARACKTTVRTVRFYEEAGLVEPSQRSEGGHRLYEAIQVLRLQLVLDLRESGLALQDIKDLFCLKKLSHSSVEASERMVSLLQSRVDEMQAKITVLRRLREELATMVAMLADCGECRSASFPSECAGCDVMARPDLPRAMLLLWGNSE